VQEVKVRLVLVIGLSGLIQIWNQESESPSAVVCSGRKVGQRHCILHIHCGTLANGTYWNRVFHLTISLDIIIHSIILRREPAIDQNVGEVI